MRIVLVGNISNGIGLERDATLLSAFLVSRGHSVTLQPYDRPSSADGHDLGIFLETISEHLLPAAARWWLTANPEWTKPESIRPIQRHCALVIAKTPAAAESLRAHFSPVAMTGFLTADKRDPSIARIPSALHLGGNSGYRGTNSVILAWRDYRYWDDSPLPPLTVISNSRETTPFDATPGITFIRRATDEQVTELQNSHLYHVLPSAYEGWGHALHESQSVGAILLTTAAAPMSDLHAAVEVAPYRTRRVNLATLADVSPESVRTAIPRLLELPSYEIARMQVESRARFEKGNQDFATAMDALLNPVPVSVISVGTFDAPLFKGSSPSLLRETHMPRAPRGPLRIALLGNLDPPHSTENDLAWTLRDLGHRVIPFQEDRDSTDAILAECLNLDVHLLLYVHTHGWNTPGKLTLDDLICRLRSSGVRTASFHLDRYWGLNINDRREERIGEHAFWHTDHIFTADGANQERFAARGVHHHWLPPGVVRRECVFGTQRGEQVDVGFVGAESYHPEYPFRGQLIEFLHAVYGERFRVFTGYRGQELNDLYASISVVVGDSCFGGADSYWSDRVPETLGRGGFLVHPATRGLCIPGLLTFTPGDLQELRDKIDYSLAHDSFRKWSRSVAQQWVTDNETYHNRMTTLLREVGLG